MSDTSYSALAKRAWLFLRWQTITRADNQPYLRRLVILRCPWFALYLHIFLGDDDLCEHDHPWAFLSVILWGGYWEIASQREPVWYCPGTILWRAAKWRHRIVRGKRTPVTLVLTGKKARSWGFWTPRGWIYWRDYSHKEHCA